MTAVVDALRAHMPNAGPLVGRDQPSAELPTVERQDESRAVACAHAVDAVPGTPSAGNLAAHLRAVTGETIKNLAATITGRCAAGAVRIGDGLGKFLARYNP